MNVFEDVVQAAEASETCREAVQFFRREQEDMDKAIRDRIRRSRKENAEAIAHNEEIMNNPQAPVTQKRIAGLELERLQSQVFSATAEEILEFRRATERAKDAILDYEKTKKHFREAHKAALDALNELKEQGAPSMELQGQAQDNVDRAADVFERFTSCGNFT